jgi:hypothetical protein
MSVAQLQTNFTAGELSPLMHGRVDYPGYANAAKQLRNVIVHPQGGAQRRPGTLYRRPAKNALKKARLVDFVKDAANAYAVEFGDTYCRFFKDGDPVLENGVAITAITKANPAVVSSAGHNFTNGEAIFISGVVGMTEVNNRWFTVAGAVAGVSYQLSGVNSTGYTTYTSGGTAQRTYEIASPYTEAQLPDLDWTQDGDTVYLFHPDVQPQRLRRFSFNYWDLAAAPFTTTPFAEIGIRPLTTLTLSLATVGAGRTATAGVAAFEPSDVGRTITYNAGLAQITGYTSSTVVTVTIIIAFPSTSLATGWTIADSPQTTCTPSAASPLGASITLTLGAGGFRTALDTGKFVRINGGLVRLTAISSNVAATGTIEVELTGTAAAPALAWTLESSQWNAVDGYPRTGAFHEQRLIAAGNANFPQAVWGSRVGEPLDFLLTARDGDGFSFEIANTQSNKIEYVRSIEQLMIFTYGGEHSMTGAADTSITPTSVKNKQESGHGCRRVRPIVVNKRGVFVQRSGRRVRSLGYNYDFRAFQSPDISILAEHLWPPGVTTLEMAWMAEPVPLIWCVLSDGTFVTCTYEYEQSVLAWTKHATDGQVESICAVPSTLGEKLYLIVKRTIDGATVRYVETIDLATTATGASEKFGILADCAGAGTAAPTTVFNYIDWLEGREISVLADGALMQPVTVSGGSFTLPRAYTNLQGGLPFTSTIELLPPEMQTQQGSIQAAQVNVSSIFLRVYNTIGGTINGETIPVRNFGQLVLNQPPVPVTGVLEISGLQGWQTGDAPALIEQKDILPFTILSVVRDLTAN